MINSKISVRNVVVAGLLLAVGLVLPTMFHFAGPQAGKIFLPLFWAVGLSSLILPLNFSVAVAVILPFLSYTVSSMPTPPMLYFMVVELIAYVVVANLISKKLNAFLSIAIALLVSRTVYVISVVLIAEVFALPAPYTTFAVLLTSIASSLPGIVAQIVVLPVIAAIYKKVDNNSKIA